jgi:hypothetical protein
MIKNIYNKTKEYFAKKTDKTTEQSVAFVMGDNLLQGINPEDASLADYNSMRYDEQVSVCLEVRVLAMLAKGWTIQPAEGQEELALEIESNLNNLKGSFFHTLKQIEMSKKVNGFSLSEKNWVYEEGKLKIASIKTRSSLKIKFYPNEYGDLLEDGIRQDVNGKEIPLPEEKFILHVNNMENSNYYGVSELKSAYKAWKIKDILDRFYNIMLERFGIPPIIATYNPDDFNGLSADQIKVKLRETAAAIKKSQQGGVIMIPNTYAHDVINMDASSGDAFEKALDRQDFRISKALKVPSELGFLNVKVGSNAKATTQYDVLLWIVNQDKLDLEETINEQLIKQYVIYNYGIKDAYPKFKLNPTNEDDIEQIIKLYNDTLKSGATRPTKAAEAKILELLGFPEMNDKEILDTKPVKEEKDNPDDPKPTVKKGVEVKEEFGKKSYNGWELEGAQLKVNFAKIESFFEEKETSMMASIQDLIDEIHIDVSNKVANKKIVSGKKYSDIENFLIKGSYIGQLKTIFQKHLKQAAKEGKLFFLEEMQPQKFALPENELLEPEYFDYISTLSKEVAGEIAGLYLIETKKTLLAAIQKGWSEKKTIQALQEVYNLAKLPDGIASPAITENRLMTIVRTNLNAAFNKGRHIQAIQMNDKTKDVYYKVFSEILDGRNHPFSAFIHGKAVRVGTELDQRLSYPLHYNDRGVAVYVNATIEGDPPNILTAMPSLASYSGLLIS